MIHHSVSADLDILTRHGNDGVRTLAQVSYHLGKRKPNLGRTLPTCALTDHARTTKSVEAATVGESTSEKTRDSRTTVAWNNQSG